MKKLFHNKANLILLILMTIWTTIILIVQAIPELKFIIRVTDIMIEEISYGYGAYADNIFKQTDIVYPIAYNIFHTSTLACVVIISILSIFKPKMIKALGISIIVQNTLLLALEAWNKFLTDQLKENVLIDIKIYLGIIVIITIIFTIISFKKKIFYILITVITLLRCFNTINIVSEYFESIDNIHAIFMYFCEIVTIVLYWIVLISINKNNKLTTDTM